MIISLLILFFNSCAIGNKPLPKRLIGEYWKYILAILILCFFGLYSLHLYNDTTWYSRSLEDTTDLLFVGRDSDMERIENWLDFQNRSVRIVSVHGPPGIGKSALAKKIGQRMVKKRIVVIYVNLEDYSYPSNSTERIQHVLAVAILKNSEFVPITKSTDFDQLKNWVASWSELTVIILDNCDDVLNKQRKEFQEVIEKIANMSSQFKILTTSREINIPSLVYFKQHRVSELSLDAAVSLLKESDAIMTEEESIVMANLTGRIPLALKLVGALLHFTPPQEIISKLQDHPIKILNSSDLPERNRIHVSFSLSLRYLDEGLKNFGCSLALFPGSFTKESVRDIVIRHMHNDDPNNPTVDEGLKSLFKRSLLEWNGYSKRYYYHRLIREFMRGVVGNDSQSLESEFFVAFHRHYSHELYSYTTQFSDSRPSLDFLDSERHNIKLILDHLVEHKFHEPEEFIIVFTAIASAFHFDVLTARFTKQELLTPFHEALVHFDSNVEDYMIQLNMSLARDSCDFEDFDEFIRDWTLGEAKQYDGNIILNAHRLINTYEILIRNLAIQEYKVNGVKAAQRVYLDRESTIERMKQSERPYVTFCEGLAFYYDILGQKTKANLYYEKANEIRLKENPNCKQKASVAYHTIPPPSCGATIHDCYEQELEKENVTGIDRARILVELCINYEYLGYLDKYEECLINLVNLHNEILEASTYKVFRNSVVVRRIANFLYRHEKYDEARLIKEKLEDSVLTGLTKQDEVHMEEYFVNALAAAKVLFHSGKYMKVIMFSLRRLDELNSIDNNEVPWYLHAKEGFKLLTGRAKFHTGSYSEGLSEIEAVYLNSSQLKGDRFYRKYQTIMCRYLVLYNRKYLYVCGFITLNILYFAFAVNILNLLMLLSLHIVLNKCCSNLGIILCKYGFCVIFIVFVGTVVLFYMYYRQLQSL